MTSALLVKLWRDARWLLLGCMLVQFAFAAVRVWFISKLDGSRFEQILELLPGDIQKWTPVDFEWAVGYSGRIAFTFEEPMVHLILFVWCVARGSDAVSGELDRGTMEMLLSQPLSRLRYLLCHASITILGVLLISGAVWGGLWVAVALLQAKVLEFPTIDLGWWDWRIPIPFAPPVERSVPLWDLIEMRVFSPAVLSLAAMGLLIAGLTTAISSADRYRWRTIGIAASFYLVQTIIKMLATAVPWLGWLHYLTIFSAFEPEKYVAIADLAPQSTWALWLDSSASAAGRASSGLGAGGSILFFLLLSGACFALAAWIFRRRDLPAPL